MTVTSSSSDGDLLRKRPGKMREMHLPSSRSSARKLTKSEMQCQERSPGGGNIFKHKRGTPKKTVASIRKSFENSTTTSTVGNFELLLQPSQIKLNLPQREYISGQKTKICADQPEGGDTDSSRGNLW